MPSVAETPSARHRQLLEITSGVMAKADLKKLEINLKAAIGGAVEDARKSLGWSQKELASAIDKATGVQPGDERDVAQISRWEKGSERPQFDVLWAVEPLRGPLVIALASLSQQIEVVTEIRVRRSA